MFTSVRVFRLNNANLTNQGLNKIFTDLCENLLKVHRFSLFTFSSVFLTLVWQIKWLDCLSIIANMYLSFCMGSRVSTLSCGRWPPAVFVTWTSLWPYLKMNSYRWGHNFYALIGGIETNTFKPQWFHTYIPQWEHVLVSLMQEVVDYLIIITKHVWLTVGGDRCGDELRQRSGSGEWQARWGKDTDKGWDVL